MATHQALTFSQTSSNPGDHLTLLNVPDSDPGKLSSSSVQVKLLAAPINPQDLLVLTGRYPVKPLYTLPNGDSHAHIAGFEGVAEILHCGSDVDQKVLRPGDRIIPRRHGLGTWRGTAIWDAKDLFKISPQLSLQAAAVLRMSALPAYLLLEDMCTLKPGDWIIQNAGGGIMAQLVVQLARLRGVHTVSVIRDRPVDLTVKVKESLTALGAVVLTESELDDPETLKTLTAGNRRFVLALDAVFGRSAEKIADVLSPGGLLVNYGSLGASTFTLTQNLLFWKRIQLRNFRLSHQLGLHSQEEQEDVLRWLEQLFIEGQLVVPPLEEIAWDDRVLKNVKEAVTKSEVGARKNLIVFP